MKAILRFKKWMKKGKTLNMVPMVVGNENVGFDTSVALPARPAIVLRVQMIAEHAQAGAAIEDEMRSVRDRQFQARRVPAVAICIALKRRR